MNSIPVDVKLILFRFATKNRVIFKHQALFAVAEFLMKLIGGSETRKPAADNNEVEFLTGVRRGFG